MAVLQTHTCLERVVVEVGLVLLLVDVAEAGKVAVEVRVQRSVGHALAVVVRIGGIGRIRQRQGVDLPVVVLVPADGADILHHRDDRWSNLPLHSKAEIRRSGRRIVVLDVGHCGRKRLSRCQSGQGAGVGVGEVDVVGGGLVGKRWIQGGVVDIVALDALIEHAEPAAENRLSVAEEVVGKAYSRLESVVIVLDVSAGEAIDAGFLDAVEIKRARGSRESRERTGFQRAGRGDRIAQRGEIVRRNKVCESVVALKGMRQSVVTEPDVEGQPGSDVPVIVEIHPVVVVDPVFVVQELQLGKAGGVPEQEIDIRVAGKVARVESRGPLGVGLQLLVLVVVQQG